MTALAYSDTATVGTWPNETGESDATQATESKKPIFTASSARYNNQPCLTYSVNTRIMSTSTFAVNPSPPYSIVVVGAVGGNQYSTIVDGRTGATDRNVIQRWSTSKWSIYAGGSHIKNGTSNTAVHGFRALFDGGTSTDYLHVDNVTTIAANVGPQTIDGITLGNYQNGGNVQCADLALVGIYEGDITADGSWAGMQSWVSSHYGVSI